ncbi:MAG TPA: OprD family outer membrane porin [Candidatus Methylomirabilis sp.]|nr:OprD family outer membrane porin [Candidatus Methylomirabilis sp.]
MRAQRSLWEMPVLALVLSMLVPLPAAADDRYIGSEQYQGYGPIDEQLNVENPLIPKAIGPRLLRDYIPGLADEMRTWPSFFGDLQLDLHLRSYYFNRELPTRPAPSTGSTSFNQEAWALGGWMGLQSGWLLDTFRMGAVAYMSQPAYAPDSRDGTGLLGPGQTSITTPGQAYGQLRYEDYVLLTGGRQLVNQGYVNPQDNRMIPNTFEGVTATGDLGPVQYYVGYLTAMKRRNSEDFINMAAAAGVTSGENRGMVITTFNLDPSKGPAALAVLDGLQLFVGNYYVPDVFNTFFVNPEYRRALTEDWRVRFGFQYLNQNSVGSNLLTDFSTWNVGSRIDVGWRGLTFVAMMSATGETSGLLKPYGATPGYVSLLETDFNLANEKAWETGFTFDWSGTTFPSFKIPGLWTSLLYAEGFDIHAQAQNVAVGKRRELDFFATWRPPQVPGFQTRFLASGIQQEPQSRVFYDFRIIMDFELPLF